MNKVQMLTAIIEELQILKVGHGEDLLEWPIIRNQLAKKDFKTPDEFLNELKNYLDTVHWLDDKIPGTVIGFTKHIIKTIKAWENHTKNNKQINKRTKKERVKK